MNNGTTIGLDLGNKKHKVCGHMLPKCDAGGFHRHLDEIPPSEYWKFEPLVDRLESLAENIGMYDWKIQDYADVHLKEDAELLRMIPGVGPITSCAYAVFAPDPKKFGSPHNAGCYFELTAGPDQSGDIDKPRKITKVAVARKLAVVIMEMLQSRKPYQDDLAARQETVDIASV